MAYSVSQWERARAYYEAGTHTLQKIEDEVGINKGHLSRTAKKQLWKQGSKADYIEARIMIAEKKATEKATTLQILDDIADEAIRHKQIINSNAELIASKIPIMLDQIDSASDLKTLAEANDRLAITLKVADRHAKSGEINVNATAAVQNNNNLSKDEMIEEAKRRGIPLDFIGL
jgi:hypothetical protein